MTDPPPPTSSALSASQYELEKRNFHLKTLYDVSQVIGSLRDVQSILKNLLMMVMGTFGTLRGIALLVDTDKGRLEASAQRSIPKSTVALLQQYITAGAFEEIRELKDILILEEQQPQGEMLDLLIYSRIRVWIPFTVNENIQGGIGLGEKLSGDSYSLDDQELLSTLSNQLTIALDNALAYREIEQLNQRLEEKVQQRTEELQIQHKKLKEANSQLELRTRFIRTTFGRYLSDEVVTSLLESPEGLKLGGEKRKVAILMSDLRGFTSLAERLAPEQVVCIINGI